MAITLGPLRVERIYGYGAVSDVELAEKLTQHRDLVRRQGHLDLPDHDAAGVVHRRQKAAVGGWP